MDLTFDAQGFGAGDQRVQWAELTAVGIKTTADGPFADDVFWQFLLPGGVLELPGPLIDDTALAAMQAALPRFDSMKVIDAMGSTRERTFRVWHREDSHPQWEPDALATRFAALVTRLGGHATEADPVFRRLVTAWTSPGRRYHDLEHLADCLREVDRSAAPPSVADLAELALWYHDVVWAPRATDAEARSAARLEADAALLSLSPSVASAAAACVRATAHLAGVTPSGAAAELVVDADLAILGRDPLRFLEYEFGVAEEHPRTPSIAFILARGRFLAGLLASPAIFRTQAFRDRYEATARANLAALLGSPRYRMHRWLGRAYRLVAPPR